VTDRDLALEIVADGRDAKPRKQRASVTCHAEDDLQNALDAISAHIPVIDDNNRIPWIIAQVYMATRLDQPEKTAANG